MTEISLEPPLRDLVLHWGAMGARWGVNRTVAQIHALLYFGGQPLTADDLVEKLGVARSNVSNSLRELQSLGVIQTRHVPGDRRDHFESIQDVWQMFEILLDERKRREVDPTLKALREAAARWDGTHPAAAGTRERLAAMLQFFETMDGWYGEMRRLPLAARVKLVRWGSRLRNWLK